MKLLLIDGNSILNRAFYGIRPLTTSKGLNTNAVYGFLTILHKHMQQEQPCRVCAAFDRKEKTPRHLLYDKYKAGRKPMPQELYEQMPIIKQVLAAMGIPCIEKAGLEADDIIGTLSAQCQKDGQPCIIITGDRDAFQLISPLVTVKLATTKASEPTDETYTPERIFEKYGLTPDQLIDLKALMGDSSDNIPGVPGVGEKTAVNLLKKHETLENVFEHAPEEKGALKEKLLTGKDSAFMSRQLGKIVRDAELEICEQDIQPPVFNADKLLPLFSELEMNSMPARFGIEPEHTKKREIQQTTPDEAPELFNSDIIYLLYDNDLFIKYGESVVTVPPEPEYLGKLAEKKLVVHDAKPFLHLMIENNLDADILFDTMIAAYVLNPSMSSYPIETLAWEYAQMETDDPNLLAACLDSVYQKMSQKLQEDGQADLFYNIELPLCSVLAKMEYNGFTLNKDFLEQFGKSLEQDIALISRAIYDIAGEEFNINSPKQLGSILFEKLHLPAGKKTKSGFSTSKEALEKVKWKQDHPIIDNILDYRMLTKLKSTYIDAFLQKLDKHGKIHTVFTQTVTQTGRISSIEPNLQNIPVRTNLGRQLRRAFTATDGYVLLDADYSQIELRVLAHISGDKVMQEAFNNNADIHTITASQVFGLLQAMITPELRRRAKAVNFGIVYGIGEYSLSQDIGVSVKEAKNYITNYLETYSGVRRYMENIVEYAKENGYVTTLFGRRRYVPDIHAKNKQIQAFAQRVCMNTPIQGTAADLIKLAMVRVDQTLRQSGLDARLLLQVHDELIVEARQDQAQEAKQILQACMERAAQLSVPLLADVGEGKTWFDAKQ